MPLVSLRPALAEANRRRSALLGLVCLGWEDAVAFVRAGEAVGAPVILQAGPGARRHIPIAVWGAIFRALGEEARTDVIAHLDHGASADECFAALDAGFTSVMFDGSQRPLADNICETQRVIARAEAYGASTEAEVGYVGYAGGAASEGTDPTEAATFHAAAPVDCLAVSVGNVHLNPEAALPLDFAQLAAVERAVRCPLVLHGGSGVIAAHRREAARAHRVRKINLGTEIRQVYGRALREVLAADPEVYDRLAIQAPVTDALQAATQEALSQAWGTQPPVQ